MLRSTSAMQLFLQLYTQSSMQVRKQFYKELYKPFNKPFNKPFSTRILTALGMVVALQGISASRASAQIGHLPSKSPYTDVSVGQTLSVMVGQFNSGTGVAGVLPKSSLFGGVRYDLPLGGPGYLTARYVVAPSERALLLPRNPRATRLLGTESVRTHIADIGFTIALTGRKSWHRLVPSISAGTGLASDFSKADTGNYKFGTKFAFTLGGNMRYMLKNGWAIRADATNYFWRNAYPDSYYMTASDTTRVLTPDISKKAWGGTWALSLGVAVPIFRK